MKFLRKKLAFTLVELIVWMVISSILFFIVFTFITSSLEKIKYSNYKTNTIDEAFNLKDDLNQFLKWNYFDMSALWIPGFNVLLIKDLEWEDWMIFWAVNKDTMKLQQNYVYWDNVFWYRRLSETEINDIELDNNEIYDLVFFNDKLYNNLKIRGFWVDFYNSWTILDLSFSVFYELKDLYIWESMTWITFDYNEYVIFNLNF